MCKIHQQFDEMACGSCGLRWSIDEPKPNCASSAPLARVEADALLVIVSSERTGLTRSATAFDTAMRIANRAYRLGKESK